MTIARAGAAVLILALAGCGSATSPASPAVRTVVTSSADDSSEAGSPAGAITEQRFWQLVGASQQGTGGDADQQAETLRALLTPLPTAEVVAFQYRLVTASRALYTWRLAGAGDLLCGSLGDDGFTDFRTWVITRGHEAFTAALTDPDTLAPHAQEMECPGAELFGAVPFDVYRSQVGREMYEDDETIPILEPGSEPPAGQGRISPGQAAELFPQLAAAALGE